MSACVYCDNPPEAHFIPVIASEPRPDIDHAYKEILNIAGAQYAYQLAQAAAYLKSGKEWVVGSVALPVSQVALDEDNTLLLYIWKSLDAVAAKQGCVINHDIMPPKTYDVVELGTNMKVFIATMEKR